LSQIDGTVFAGLIFIQGRIKEWGRTGIFTFFFRLFTEWLIFFSIILVLILIGRLKITKCKMIFPELRCQFYSFGHLQIASMLVATYVHEHLNSTGIQMVESCSRVE
jgi:hypothetical protein